MITILGTSTSASAAPEAAFSADAEGDLGALPSPVAGVADPAGHVTPRGPLILQTTLLGPLTVPDGAARAAEIEELSRRAAMYATRAKGDGTRRAYRSASWRPGAPESAANHSPLIPTPSPCTWYAVPTRVLP